MAELLWRIRDKIGHNPMLLGEREVVSVCPDGWEWTELERKNPDWRILIAKGMSVEEAEQFVAPEPVDENLYIRRRRAFKLDLVSIGVDVTDDTRAEVTKEVDSVSLVASKQAREPLPKGDVIGPARVIRRRIV